MTLVKVITQQMQMLDRKPEEAPLAAEEEVAGQERPYGLTSRLGWAFPHRSQQDLDNEYARLVAIRDTPQRAS